MNETITLSGGVLVLLREALYSRLSKGSEALATALAIPEPERSLSAHAAYLELCAFGSLLGRLGWVEPASQSPLALENPGEARLVIDVLTAELESEAGNASTRRRFGEHDAALTAEQRWQAIHAALWRLETAAAGAGPTDIKLADDARA